MNYFLAQEIGSTVTYGELVQTVASDGPADDKLIVGDVIVGINQTRITSSDQLAGYLAENTVPNDTIVIEVERDNQMQNLEVVLGTRPPVNG